MSFIKNLFKKENKADKLAKKQRTHHDECMNNKEYYWSEEAKTTGKQIDKNIKEYIENNPEEFTIRGAKHYKLLIDACHNEDKEIYTLTGMGLHEEQDNKNYAKAIEYYQKAYDLCIEIHRDQISELKANNGDGEFLHCFNLARRIRVCNGKLGKLETKLESNYNNRLNRTMNNILSEKFNELMKFYVNDSDKFRRANNARNYFRNLNNELKGVRAFSINSKEFKSIDNKMLLDYAKSHLDNDIYLYL